MARFLIQGLIFSQSFFLVLGATLGRQEQPSKGCAPPPWFTYSKEQEWNIVMHRTVEEVNSRAEAVGEADCQADAG